MLPKNENIFQTNGHFQQNDESISHSTVPDLGRARELSQKTNFVLDQQMHKKIPEKSATRPSIICQVGGLPQNIQSSIRTDTGTE